MYGAGELKKIAVAIDEDSFVSSLEQVTAPVSLRIEIGSVRAADEMHDGTEVCVGRLPQQMIVIPHEDIGMEDKAIPFPDLFQILLELSIVLVAEEDLLPFVSPAGNMIEGVFILNT